MAQDLSTQTKEAFDAQAQAGHWVCWMCGKAIEYEDREAYSESKRCRRCHDEVDTDSGPIPTL